MGKGKKKSSNKLTATDKAQLVTALLILASAIINLIEALSN